MALLRKSQGIVSILVLLLTALLFWWFWEPTPMAEVRTSDPHRWPFYAGTMFSEEPLLADLFHPEISHVSIPDFPGAFAIWGAIGRGSDDSIWFSAASHGIESQSGRLFAFDPRTNRVEDHGDILTQLRRVGHYRVGMQQPKIHTKILPGTDGFLYFASTDDPPKHSNTSQPPVWGSHLWRYRPGMEGWQHLRAFPEGFIALNGNGIVFYGLLYPDHQLVQWNSATSQFKQIRVGSVEGHISRHLICDHRGHAYVPRLRMVRSDHAEHTLVEFDAELNEVAEFPLPYYQNGSAVDSHGIIAYQALPDRSICFTTHSGRLFRIIPQEGMASQLEDLGWFHPQGPSYASGLFTFSGETFLVGIAEIRGKWDWVCFDLLKRRGTVIDLQFPRDHNRHAGDPLLYGCSTRDHEGAFYLGGSMRNALNQRVPVLMRLVWRERLP